MGLILDSNILIAGERRRETIQQIIQGVKAVLGDSEAALSAISVVELTHGIYRAKTVLDLDRRRIFCEEVCQSLVVQPVTLEIAQLAGQIEGEQAARGVSIAFEDLLIGATALHLGFDVVTLNPRHFLAIPGLKVITI